MDVKPERYYVYGAELRDDSFRLLQIQLEGELNLACKLTIHPIAECPPYIALSYAWHEPEAALDGEKSDIRYVKVDGREISVTTNLFYALHHLARQQAESSSPYSYWIDALCIDQRNDEERTSQVAIMHRIYRLAEKVCVWLGPDHRSEAYTIREFFRFLLQKYYCEDDDHVQNDGHPARYRRRFLEFVDWQVVDAAGLPDWNCKIWEVITRFWDRGWFSRMWVMQEITLARDTEVWCGDIEFQQFEITEISNFLGNSGLSQSLIAVRRGFRSPTSVEGRSVGSRMSRVPTLQKLVRGSVIRLHPPSHALAARLVGPACASAKDVLKYQWLILFTALLHSTHLDDASDPRDRVFALLVLFRQYEEVHGWPQMSISVNYSKSVDEVFTETTACVIEECGWLGIICLLRDQIRNTTDRLPSWVPDYSSSWPSSPLHRRIEDTIKRVEAYDSFITPQTKPVVFGRSLMISTKLVGVVADLGETLKTMHDDGCFGSTASLLRKFPKIIDKTGRTRIDVLIDTLASLDFTELDRDGKRAAFNHWYAWATLRKFHDDIREGRILQGSDNPSAMSNFEHFAGTEASATLPTFSYFGGISSNLERWKAIVNRSPTFRPKEGLYRKVIRITQPSFPLYPSAQLLGFAPGDTQIGDEVCLVAGTIMPVVLRRKTATHTATGSDSTCTQGVMVGEAFVDSFDDAVPLLDGEPWQRWQIW